MNKKQQMQYPPMQYLPYLEKKKFYKKWWFLALSAVLLTLLLCSAIVFVSLGGIDGIKAVFQGGLGLGDDIFDTSQYENETNYVELYKGRKYVLLLGTDARASDKGVMTRADTIILACLNTEKQKLALYSIPRDTYVYIPGYGYDKINASTVYGGPELCMQVVSTLVGVKIEDYVLIDYGGFEAAVDALGGVYMNVEEDMYHYDPEENEIYTINIKAGFQHLDGSKALQYVRYRSYELGDIARTSTQQKFLAVLSDQLFRSGTISKLPDLISSISSNLKTSLSFKEMYQLASTAASMDSLNIATQTLPGTFMDLNDISYWKVNQKVARQALIDIFEEDKASEVITGTGITGYSGNDDKGVPDSGSEMDKQMRQIHSSDYRNNNYSHTDDGTSKLQYGTNDTNKQNYTTNPDSNSLYGSSRNDSGNSSYNSSYISKNGSGSSSYNSGSKNNSDDSSYSGSLKNDYSDSSSYGDSSRNSSDDSSYGGSSKNDSDSSSYGDNSRNSSDDSSYGGSSKNDSDSSSYGGSSKNDSDSSLQGNLNNRFNSDSGSSESGMSSSRSGRIVVNEPEDDEFIGRVVDSE